MFRKNLLAICAVGVCIVSFGASASEQQYKVSFDVSTKGSVVASPIVVVREGEQGSIEISGRDGYKLTFTASDAGDGKIRIAAHFASDRSTSTPVATVKDGQAGSLSDGRFEFKFVASRKPGASAIEKAQKTLIVVS